MARACIEGLSRGVSGEMLREFAEMVAFETAGRGAGGGVVPR